MKYKIDNLTKDGSGYVAYIHILDIAGNILATESLKYENKIQFKKELIKKTAKIKIEHDEKEAKKIEIEQALREVKL